MRTDDCRHQRTGTRTGNDTWQQTLAQQSLDHTHMVEAQHTATTKHQGGTAKADIGAIKKVELLLGSNVVTLQLRKKAQRVIDLINILLYQGFGAKFCTAIETMPPHTA